MVIARHKLHVAPLAHQEKAIQRLIREGRFKNVTEFVRNAIDCYLERLGRPSLVEQARMMADDFAVAQSVAGGDPQDASRSSDETW